MNIRQKKIDIRQKKTSAWRFFVTFVFLEKNENMKRIVIFASGSGSNAQAIIEYFSVTGLAEVSAVFSNRKDAYVLQRAEKMDVPVFVFDKADLYENDAVLLRLSNIKPDLVVLAGFLWKIPEKIVHAFQKRIINIHPALLPSYGGKGMYGMNVHRAVIENCETVSGITIHYVNENYDEGSVILQVTCEIGGNDTPESLAEKIHSLEHKYYPRAIEQVLACL